MPSRAETRGGIETALRALSLVILAWMLWLSFDRGGAEKTVSARSANLGAALHDWSVAGIAPDRIAVQLDSAPAPGERDWLAALDDAGSMVTWSGNVPAVAIAAQPVASPRGGLIVLAAAPEGSALRVSDEVGPLDTAESRAGGARFSVPAATGSLAARAGGGTARVSIPEAVSVRRVLVLGSAGWEAKFVVAALEEDGWKVDASMYVAPGVSVTQGVTAPIDTARYSAVIALDGAAASRASEIGRYVVNGGGLILAGNASALDAFNSLRAGAPGRVSAPAVLPSEGPVTLQSLSFVPVAGLKPDAIALERRGAAPTAAARRHFAGRVLQQGYLETWRWRMAGADKSVDEHRAWWTRAVSSVAYVPRPSVVREDSLDDAPIARLVGALGPPTAASGPSLASAATAISLWWLFGVLALSLLAEWLSRRTRGLR